MQMRNQPKKTRETIIYYHHDSIKITFFCVVRGVAAFFLGGGQAVRLALLLAKVVSQVRDNL
jgi:hypothetical protein